MRRSPRQAGPAREVLARADLRAGERVLAATAYSAPEPGGWLLGTRLALLALPAEGEVARTPWEQVHDAGWDLETGVLTVSEVGEYGAQRPVRRFTIDEPGRVLELVRERVSASLVMQRRVTVAGAQGLSVIARRPPAGSGESGGLSWYVDFDNELDPSDPVVRDLAAKGLAAARAEVDA